MTNLVKELVAFIKERDTIRIKKEMGAPRPWTSDPILDKYRFCNIHREDDRVTRELGKLAPRGHEDEWFWWVVARLFNRADTMITLEPALLPFNPENARKRLKHARELRTIFNAAYIVSTNGKSMDKVDYLIDLVLKPLWKDRKRLRPQRGEKLADYHALLMGYDGLGSFMAAQVIADLKYVAPLKGAVDWHDWAASGPGSRRGMNRVFDRDVEASWPRGQWEASLEGLRGLVEVELDRAGIQLHAQDLQNCLCEFDKYCRAKFDGRQPKQIYKEK